MLILAGCGGMPHSSFLGPRAISTVMLHSSLVPQWSLAVLSLSFSLSLSPGLVLVRGSKENGRHCWSPPPADRESELTLTCSWCYARLCPEKLQIEGSSWSVGRVEPNGCRNLLQYSWILIYSNQFDRTTNRAIWSYHRGIERWCKPW